MTFTCQQCGECCGSMGEIIEIEEQTGPLEFRIRFTATGEERMVSVDHDKQDLFRSQEGEKLRSMACPFLREIEPGKNICSVHHSRPELCRQYSCFRILVLDAEGKRAGRVADASRYFTTFDPRLRALWDTEITPAGIEDEDRWEDHAEEVLTRNGYRAIR